MNQKQCKALRKKAKELAQQEQTEYQQKYKHPQFTLKEDCIRGVYKKLKKEFAKANNPQH